MVWWFDWKQWNFRQTPKIGPAPKIWPFWAWWAGTNSWYSTWRESAIKAGHWGIPHLESTCARFNTSARRRMRPSAGPERSQQLQIPPSLNSKAILQQARLLFLLPQHWRAPSFFRQRFWRRQVFNIRQRFWIRQVFSIRQRFWIRQVCSIRQRFWMHQVFTIRQRFWRRQCFWMSQCFCIYFAEPIFLCIFLHSYLVCANNLIGTDILRLFRSRLFCCGNDYVFCVSWY